LKLLVKIFFFLLLTGSGVISAQTSEAPADSMKLLAQYSLFSEYHKNKDYQSALPYGWNVLQIDKKKFAKWIYFKMEDCLWYMHDSTGLSADQAKIIADTTLYLYNLAAEYDLEAKGYFLAKKAFISETWLGVNDATVRSEYEKAIAADSTISTYYYDRLGDLYLAKKDENPEYKMKGLDLYQYLSNKEPDNQVWPEKQEKFVDNLGELVDLAKKQWDLDPQSLEKAWKYASVAIRDKKYAEAITALEFLVSKSPSSVSYWTQLASTYNKNGQLDKAESAYKKLISLEPDKKEDYLNLGILYRDKNQFAAARSEFEKASQVGNGWGLPIYYIGNLYEQAARNCGFEFEDKLVYLLAVDTYKRAISMDPSVTQAQERIGALATSVPSKEDYFFRGLKSGQSVSITGKCYDWIGKSVTVP
jgi:tetratricopeptide (TPR) repeat protein